MEQVVLALDIEDIGMAGDDPEGIETLDLGYVQRRVLAQPGKGIMRSIPVGIGFWVNDVCRNLARDGHGVLLLFPRLWRVHETHLPYTCYTTNKYVNCRYE